MSNWPAGVERLIGQKIENLDMCLVISFPDNLTFLDTKKVIMNNIEQKVL